MPSTPEYTESVAGTPEVLFEAVKYHHEWAPKLIPHMFTDVDRPEGDGYAGSVFHYDAHEDYLQQLDSKGDDAHGGTPMIKVVMEEYNPETLSYVMDYLGDPRYSHLLYNVKFLPGPSPNTTDIKWRIEYSPYSEETGAPDDLVDINIVGAGFKDLAAHLEEA